MIESSPRSPVNGEYATVSPSSGLTPFEVALERLEPDYDPARAMRLLAPDGERWSVDGLPGKGPGVFWVPGAPLRLDAPTLPARGSSQWRMGKHITAAIMDHARISVGYADMDAPIKPKTPEEAEAAIRGHVMTLRQAVRAGMPVPTIICATGYWREPDAGPIADKLKSIRSRGVAHLLLGRSLQPFWRYDRYAPYDAWLAFQKAIINQLGSDVLKKSLADRMRMPGAWGRAATNEGVGVRLQPVVYWGSVVSLDAMVEWAARNAPPVHKTSRKASRTTPKAAPVGESKADSSRGSSTTRGARERRPFPADVQVRLRDGRTLTQAGLEAAVPAVNGGTLGCYCPTNHGGRGDANPGCFIGRSARGIYLCCCTCQVTWHAGFREGGAAKSRLYTKSFCRDESETDPPRGNPEDVDDVDVAEAVLRSRLLALAGEGGRTTELRPAADALDAQIRAAHAAGYFDLASDLAARRNEMGLPSRAPGVLGAIGASEYELLPPGRLEVDRLGTLLGASPAELVGIRASHGSGKTELLARVYGGCNRPVIAVAPTIVQTAAASERLGLRYYSHESGLRFESKRISTTLDSLWRVGDGMYDFDLIIDEAEGCLAHLARLAPARLVRVWPALYSAVGTARRIVLCDADLRPETVRFVARLRARHRRAARVPTLVLEAERGAPPVAVLNFDGWPRLLAEILKAVGAKRKLWIASESRRLMEDLDALLVEKDVKTECFTSRAPAAVRLCLSKLARAIEVNKPQVVLASPTITAAASLDAPYFDRVVAVGAGAAVGVRDLLQMARRVRKPTVPVIWAWLGALHDGRTTDPAEIHAEIMRWASSTDAMLRVRKGRRLSDRPGDDDLLLELLVDQEARLRQERHDRAGAWRGLLDEHGIPAIDLVRKDDPVEGKQIASVVKEWKAHREAEVESRRKQVKEAPDIRLSVVEHQQAHQGGFGVSWAESERAHLRESYGDAFDSDPDEVIAFDDEGKGRRAVEIFADFACGDVHRADANDRKAVDARSGLRTYRMVRGQAVRDTLSAIGVDGDPWTWPGEVKFRTTVRPATLDEAVEDEQRRLAEREARYEREARAGRRRSPPTPALTREQLERMLATNQDGSIWYPARWPRVATGTAVSARPSAAEPFVLVEERLRELSLRLTGLEEILRRSLPDPTGAPADFARAVLLAAGVNVPRGKERKDGKEAPPVETLVEPGEASLEYKVQIWRPSRFAAWERMLRLSRRQVDVVLGLCRGIEVEPVPLPPTAKLHLLEQYWEVTRAAAASMESMRPAANR